MDDDGVQEREWLDTNAPWRLGVEQDDEKGHDQAAITYITYMTMQRSGDGPRVNSA